MIDNSEILHELLTVSDDCCGDVYIYKSHMGGCYLTFHEMSVEDTYCEQCGDTDMLVESGDYVGLLKKYTRLTQEEVDDIKSVGIMILNHIDFNKIKDTIQHKYGGRCGDCSDVVEFEGCFCDTGISLDEIIKEPTIPLVCKCCVIEDRLESILL